MLVHDVDADALLLVAVDAELLGQLLEALELGVGDCLVGQVEFPEGVVVGLVLLVDQLDQAQGAAVAEQAEELLRKGRIIPVTDPGTAFEKLAEQAQDPLLLLPRRARDRTGEEEKVVADGIALEKDPLVTPAALGVVGEQQAAVLLVGGPVENQTVAHVSLGQVGQGLVDPEHVFTEGAAVSPMVNTPAVEHEAVPGGKEAQLFSGKFVKVTPKGVPGSRRREIFDGVVDMAVKADFLMHGAPS